jgi:hypothetical protein
VIYNVDGILGYENLESLLEIFDKLGKRIAIDQHKHRMLLESLILPKFDVISNES